MSKNLQLLRKSIARSEWEKIAIISGTSAAYLDQIALGFRRPSVELAEKIEKTINTLHPLAGVTKENLVFASIRPSKNKRTCQQEGSV